MTTQSTIRTMFRPSLEALEDRLVPTGLLHAPVQKFDWFTYHLSDPSVRGVARTEFNRDHALTRSDMLQIFQLVEGDGVVSAAELGDLKTLAANGKGVLHMPD